MSKGIIIVDVPKNCVECKCRLDFGDGSYCGAKAKFLDDWEFDLESEMPGWCPIHEIPMQYEELRIPHSIGDYQTKGFQRGWNAFREKILKGGEDNA